MNILHISVAFLFCVLYYCNATSLDKQYIRIALAVDDHSFKDLVILANSIINTVLNESRLSFHIAACGRDHMEANLLKKTIIDSLISCFPNLLTEVVPFVLPKESGFYKQMTTAKRKSHWYSPTGADMVRFYMASLFPNVDRLLYLDNDVIVTCCLEEIFFTDLGKNKVVGIALDNLHWAVVTQFQRHYNASHPLVVENVRRPKNAYYKETHINEPISQEEFTKALPRYPNDGVLLIDVERYTNQQVLQTIDQMAMANGRGERLVSVGTQQFTVLAMHDRWVELTPRANLRHSPDVSRGFMMWFNFNGFLHFAGLAKPRILCGPDVTYYDNELRVQSYTPWVMNNAYVSQMCPHEKLMYLERCLHHVPRPATLRDFMNILRRINRRYENENFLHVHIGPVYGNLSSQRYLKDEENLLQYHRQLIIDRNISSTDIPNFSQKPRSPSDPPLPIGYMHGDVIAYINRYVMQNTSWSIRTYYDSMHMTSVINHATDNTNSFASSRTSLMSSGQEVLSVRQRRMLSDVDALAAAKLESVVDRHTKNRRRLGRKRPPRQKFSSKTKRSFAVRSLNICDNVRDITEDWPTRDADTNLVQLNNATYYTQEVTGNPYGICKSVLTEVKAEPGQPWKHFEVVSIVIDSLPPEEFRRFMTIAAAQQPKIDNAQLMVLRKTIGDKRRSLGALLNLDLVYMRPKAIFMRLYHHEKQGLEADVGIALRWLKKMGYVGFRDTERLCSSVTPSNVDTIPMLLYECLGGTRVNAFELNN